MGDACILCGVLEKLHAAGELEGVINHRWTEVDELKPPRRRQVPPQAPRQMVNINNVDAELRRVLLAKGIITDEDFTTVLNPGSSPSGDRDPGETSGP